MCVSGQQIITSLGIAGEQEIGADLIQKDGRHGRDAVGAIIAQLPQDGQGWFLVHPVSEVGAQGV